MSSVRGGCALFGNGLDGLGGLGGSAFFGGFFGNGLDGGWFACAFGLDGGWFACAFGDCILLAAGPSSI